MRAIISHGQELKEAMPEKCGADVPESDGAQGLKPEIYRCPFRAANEVRDCHREMQLMRRGLAQDYVKAPDP